MQSDKNAERIKFSCPKIVGDNLDLSKFSVRINFENVSSVDFNVSIKDQYICDDVAVDGENVTFSWLIGKNAARYMGTVRFIVCAVKTDSDSNISVEWNTAIAEVPVLEGIEIDQPQIGQEEKDVINQLLELTKNTSAEAVQNVNSAKEQAIKDIQSVSQPDTTLTVEGGIAEAKATGEAIGSLKEDIGDIEDSFIVNLADNSKFKDGYCSNSGQIVSPSGDYFYTNKISVKRGETIYFNGTKIRFLTAYKNGVVSESEGLGVTDIGYYSVPDGVTEIVITSSPQFLNGTKNLMINKGDKLYAYSPYGIRVLKSDKIEKVDNEINGYNSVFSGSLESGVNLECETNNIVKNKNMMLYADISSFDSIVVGHGFLSYDGSALLIDSTNVQVIKYAPSAEVIKTVAHGLTISDFIGVSISVDNQRKANILITTKMGGFALNDVSWGGCSGSPFVRPRNCTLTNCKLTFACKDYQKGIWAFGDSYMTTTAKTRYPYYLYELGIDNYFLDAFGGRNSKQALESLNNALKYGTPKYLLWFLGMNDPDQVSTSNTDWFEVYNEIITICKEKNIVPVFATIPCTPSNNNYYKNRVVSYSGYRYVDFAKAVGATETGSTWNDGLLSSDNLHPSEEGAKVLANQLLIGFPELIN